MSIQFNPNALNAFSNVKSTSDVTTPSPTSATATGSYTMAAASGKSST